MNHFCSCLYLSDPLSVCSRFSIMSALNGTVVSKARGGLKRTFDAPSKRFECFFQNNGEEAWQSRGCSATWVTLLHLPIHHSRPSSVHQIKYGPQNGQGNVPSGVMRMEETAGCRRCVLWVRPGINIFTSGFRTGGWGKNGNENEWRMWFQPFDWLQRMWAHCSQGPDYPL